MNAWTQQLAGLAKVVEKRDKYSGLSNQKKLAAEKLDLVERKISDGFSMASEISEETGISPGSIHSYLKVLEDQGRITSRVVKNRVKEFSVVDS